MLLSIAINVLILAIVYLIVRKRLAKILDGSVLIDEIKDEINHLIIELNQTSERNIGLIEERIHRLQKLIDETDRKIGVLGRETEKHQLSADVYDKLKRAVPLVSKTNIARPVESRQEKESPVSGRDEPPDKAGVERTKAETVLHLHRQGFDPKLIATRTSSTLGEVELIISLQNGKQ